MAKERKKRLKRVVPVQVIICGWLLIIESVILFIVGVYHFHLNNGPALFARLFAQWVRGETPFNIDTVQHFIDKLMVNASSAQLLEALIESAVMFILTILALWTAVGFFRSWQIAWVSGLMVQSGVLVTALALYFSSKPFHVFFLLAPGVFMVIYLNYADVHTYFNSQLIREAEPEKNIV